MAFRRRWIAPVAVAAAIAAGTAAPSLGAGSAPSLPSRSPAQLIAMVVNTDVHGLSGTVQASAKIGLPALPAGDTAGGEDPTAPTALLTGNHTLRVWAAAPDRLRVAIVGQLAETEFVTNGHEAWVYSSQRNAATHILFPAHATTPQRQETEPAITPQRLAERLLAAIEPSTAVSAGRDVEIAGRSAYQLVVQPRDPRSLVRSAVIAIDSKTGLVLRVTIYATGQSAPALQIGYTSLSLGTPARSRFSFTPPPQAKVNTVRVPAYRHELQHRHQAPGGATPSVIGSGWTSILMLPNAAMGAPPGQPGPAGQAALLAQLTQPVTFAGGSGRLLSTKLVTVLLTNDGRLFIGAVTPAVIEAAAAA